MLLVYSVTHFLVDFSCAFLMFRHVMTAPDWYLCVLIYNFCAFAMQMPLGILADRWNRNAVFAVIGCALIGAAYGFGQAPVAAVILAGIGNGMFHIGGGIDILNISRKRSAALGIFVSPGAFGIYFGTLLGRGTGLSPVLVVIVLLLAIGSILAIRRMQGNS